MIGPLLLIAIVVGGSWFAWLYFVSPGSDQDRIKADHGGTGFQVLDIQRIGTRHDRAEVDWVGGHPTPLSGGMWLRIYKVTGEAPNDVPETYCVGVEARLFGLPELKRIDWRS